MVSYLDAFMRCHKIGSPNLKKQCLEADPSLGTLSPRVCTLSGGVWRLNIYDYGKVLPRDLVGIQVIDDRLFCRALIVWMCFGGITGHMLRLADGYV